MKYLAWSLTHSLISCLLAFTSSGRELPTAGWEGTSEKSALISESSMSISSPENPKLKAIFTWIRRLPLLPRHLVCEGGLSEVARMVNLWKLLVVDELVPVLGRTVYPRARTNWLKSNLVPRLSFHRCCDLSSIQKIALGGMMTKRISGPGP